MNPEFRNIDIIKIDSLDDIHLIKEDWKTILKNSDNENVYADPNFFRAAFEFRAQNAKPNIVLFKKSDVPIGILLGWYSDINVPLKIGYLKLPSISLKSLHLEIDSLITDGSVSANRVISEYLKDIIGGQKVDLIYTNHMSEQNSFFYVSSTCRNHFTRRLQQQATTALRVHGPTA